MALNVTKKKRQQAILLHYSGEEVIDIVDTLHDAVAGPDDDPQEKTKTALTKHFTRKVNVAYEEYKFRQANKKHHLSPITNLRIRRCRPRNQKLDYSFVFVV